jgi:hypothetical protein
VTSVSEQQYKSAAVRAEKSRDDAAKTLAGLQKPGAEVHPLQIPFVRALQEQAKIDALHLISQDLSALREAVESLESR